MGRLHILSITLLFVLDVLFAHDGTVLATSVIRITGKDEQEETTNGYLRCEVTEPAVGTNYNLKWYDPNGQYVPFQGQTMSSQRLFASRDSSTNSISLNFMPVRELDAGLYTCTAMINGQLRNETFKITTYRGITFSNCPLEQKIISGETQQTVLCSASAGGIDLTTYWKRIDQSFQIQAGGNKYTITSAGLIIFNISKADEMIYEFNAKYDKIFAWEYRSITVKVLIKPEIVYPPTISTAKAGDRFSMLCRANGDPVPEYVWYKEGTINEWSLLRNSDRIVIDEVHGVLKIDPLRKDDEGQYKCQALNEAGFAEAQARLDVQVPPDIIEIRNATGEENGGAVIICKASGDPAPEMKWKPIYSDTFYPEGQSGDISVTLTKDQINRQSTVQLKFANLKPSHMGDYTCQAHNNAGDDIGYGHLSVRYAAKFNNQPTGPFYNWYGNEKGNVTCVVNGNPLPVVQWFKGGNQIAGQALYSIEAIEDKDKFQITSILFAKLDLSNEQKILGDYTCQGLNAAGINNITIRMVQAEKPPAPGVSVDYFSARIIRLGITVPSVRGPPVFKFKIRYKVQGSNEDPVTAEAPVEWRNYVDDKPVPRAYHKLENLAVMANYIITVTAVNDVGESAPYEFTQTTKPYSVPRPVDITSPFPDSMSPTSFLLMWEKPDDGGSEIQKYILSYREVEIIPNRTQYELSKPLSAFINVDAIPPSTVRYQLSSLIPGTYYQVEVQAVNTQGSSTPQSYIFKTKEGGITFSNCPLEQKIISGETQQTVLCSASAGGIDLTTYWKRIDQSLQIQAGGNKYAITSAGLIIFNISKADEMIYEFNAKYDKTFAWEYRSITVKVLIKPEIVYLPTISTTKAGDQFSMLCRANGDPVPEYVWYKEGTTNEWSLLRNSDRIVIDEVHGELKIDPLRKDDEGRYKCQASNEAGFAEAQARLDVQVPPDIIEIRNATGEENGGAVITCKASGDPAPEMKWKPIYSDTFYPEGQSGDLSVTLTKDQINRQSTVQLKFANLKPSHMGDYTCQAHNNAGDDIGYGHLSVRYAAKFNNQPTGPFYNWYGNEKGNVTCVVNGNPLPVVQWFKGGNLIAGQALYSIKAIEDKDKFQITSILFAKLDLSNEQKILGDYTCQGLNAAGINNITIRMVQAEKPPAPGVSVDYFSARIIRLGITVPSVRGPPVFKFKIRYKVQGSNEDPVTAEAPVEWRNYVDDKPVPRAYPTLENLAVKTNYIITVTAVNDVGESAPYEFTQTTRPYSVPRPVVITSPFPDSMSPTSFLLMWEKPDDGGSEIQKYILNYREVEIIPNRTQYELSKPLSGFINVDDIPPSAVRYQLSSLIPGTYYQVEVQAVNTQGSSTPRSYIFKTKEGEVASIYPSNDTEGTSARLVEVYGNPVGSGILEVLVNGQWGTVCDDDFDYRDADIFCRMLGFNKSSHFTSGYTYVPTASDPRSDPIWMDDLDCMGNESDVAECNFNGWGQHNCGHHEDVMLFCSNDSTTTTESYWRQTSLKISTPITNPQNYRWYNTHRWYYTSSVYTRTTSPWYPTTSSNSLENFISSSCTSSGWYIQVDMYRLRQMYPNARESDIHLGENSCTGYSNGYTLVFQHGIRDCLTSETVTQNAIVYKNRLVYAMRDPQYQFIIRTYNWTVEVECDVLRNETASSHISQNTIGPLDSGHVQGTSHYNITMRFYSDPNFQYDIPGNPLYVKVGADVYVKVYTDAADWGIKMIVRSCYTKPDPYASDSLKYYIIRDGCETDVNTHYICQSTHETKFMFRDFEYTSNHEGLYLYCDATFCETSDYSYQCQQSCDPRGKRDAESRPRLTETIQEKIIHIRK